MNPDVHLESLALLSERRKDASDRDGLYDRRRRLLTSDMDYHNPNCTVVILSRVGLISPDFIHTLLNEIDPAVEIRQHWGGRLLGTKHLCSGASAIFNNPAVARQAAEKLQLMFRSIIAVPFLEFFRALVEAEIRHPDFEGGYSRIVIKSKQLLQRDEKFLLECSLMEFGPCQKIRFHKLCRDYGTTCTVIYEFASHAIAAKCVLDDLDIGETGRISVQLRVTSKVKDILGFVKQYFA